MYLLLNFEEYHLSIKESVCIWIEVIYRLKLGIMAKW